MDGTENDLYWHALNYRTAGPNEANMMWKELEACVDRLILIERDACAKECEGTCCPIDSPADDLSFEIGTLACSKAIRAR